MSVSLEERFWNHVQICEHGIECGECCWPWRGALSNGYGVLSVYDAARYQQTKLPSKNILAHRLACEIALHAHIPTGLYALHKCNYRACCHFHPRHVYIGDSLQNIHDAIAAGTHISLHQRGAPHWRKRDPERSKQHKPVLKHPFEKIQRIRSLAYAGFPVGVIARIFGLREGYVSAVVLRKIRLDS